MLQVVFSVPIVFEKPVLAEEQTAESLLNALERLRERLEKAAARRNEILEAKRGSRKRAHERQSSESPSKCIALRRTEHVALQELRQTAAAAKREQQQLMNAKAAHMLNLVREQRRRIALARRASAVQHFVESCSGHIDELRQTGILDADAATVERLMMRDPVRCPSCTQKDDLRKKICPTTNEPHFRSLVATSKNIVDGVSSALVALKNLRDAPRVTQAPQVHPSLLIRAIHAASCSAMEVGDEELRVAAMDVAESLRSLTFAVQEHRCGATEDPTDVVHALTGFQRTWVHWASVVTDQSRVGRQVATRDALVAKLIDAILQLEAAQAFRASDIARRPVMSPGVEKILQQKRGALTEAIDEQLRQLVSDLRRIGGEAALIELRRKREPTSATQ